MSKRGALESILFVAGDEGLHLEEVSTLLGVTLLEAKELLDSLRKKYHQDDESGLTLIEMRQRFQIATKAEYSELIREYAISPFATKLSQAALETLAIIAYKQPITRMEIDRIRGVQSSGMLQRLLIRGLVKEVGREESPGRPILYGTTEYFMNYFGLNQMDELPSAETLFQMNEDELLELFSQDERALEEENE